MIEPARISWHDGQPFADDYQDIYHSVDGPAEVRRVFLEPTGFDALLGNSQTLLVGELGFGTGLNFAVIAQACIARRQRLHFVSVDSTPLAPSDFRKITGLRQNDLPIYQQFERVYPPLLPGWHRRSLVGGLITVSVFWGDVADGMQQLVAEQRRPFSLWLLDGFAPDRNADMWHPDLLSKLAAVSHLGAGVATFTSAGRVRRALEAAGFTMRRVDQRPHKRESLAGILSESGLQPFSQPTEVQIIGAGIAGASAARHLAEAGVSVTVHDGHAIAAGASAIPATVMHGRLLANQEPEGLLRAHAYLYARAYCASFHQHHQSEALNESSVLQVPSETYPIERLAAVAEQYSAAGNWLSLADADTASAIAGLTVQTQVLHFLDAWIVQTPLLCRELLDHPNIQFTVGHLDAWPDVPCIAACGPASQSLPGAEYLEIAEVAGQIDVFTLKSIRAPRAALVGNGYVAPLRGALAAGASYEYQPWPEREATTTNTEHLHRLTGIGHDQVTWQQQYRGVRSVSSDRLPIVGALYDRSGTAIADRYVSCGHGSMGTVMSHAAAVQLTAAILGDFLPLTGADRLLSPLRFRTRQARRGYKFSARD
jgi:tRNA 5-methylaminomethyl-2-thiouridine biosynthesis bifunctional protein